MAVVLCAQQMKCETKYFHFQHRMELERTKDYELVREKWTIQAG